MGPSTPPNTNRGTAWVVVQAVLLAAIFLAPARIGEFVIISEPLATIMVIMGLVIGVIGLLLIAAAGRDLGPALSVFPRPVSGGQLARDGVYRVVRHPMYSGVILSALGWAVFRNSVPAILLTLVLVVFFDRKAAQEEVWLAQKYAGYATYKQRTRKLIPFIY
jgi:protein-S-isoprenylcysteine O-methyltransferase Ste14